MLVEYIGFVDFEENVLAYLAFTFVMSPFGAVYLYIKYLEARSEAVPHQGVTRFAYSLGLGDLLARLVLDVASTVPMRHLSLSWFAVGNPSSHYIGERARLAERGLTHPTRYRRRRVDRAVLVESWLRGGTAQRFRPHPDDEVQEVEFPPARIPS